MFYCEVYVIINFRKQIIFLFKYLLLLYSFSVVSIVQLQLFFLEALYIISEANQQIDICLGIVSGLVPNRDVIVELQTLSGTSMG